MHTETILCQQCNSYHLDHAVELRAEIERLKAACIGDCENRLIEAQDEQLGLREEIERLLINLRDYRQKHRCSHSVMCWTDEIASKALARQ